MSRFSLSREERRVLAILLVAFIPFAVVVAVVVQRHTESARAGITADRLAHARAAANVADSFIAGNTSTLQALSQLAAVRGATVDDANDILGPAFRDDPNWLTMALSGADGVLSGALALQRAEQLMRDAIPVALGLRVVDSRGQGFIGPKATAGAIPVVADD